MIGLYIRVSTEGQLTKGKSGKKSDSIETQTEAGINFANYESQNYDSYIENYTVTDPEGGEEFKRLKTDIANKKLTTVWVYKMDRFPRDLNIFREVKTLCKANGCKLYIADFGGYQDLNDDTADFTGDLLALFAEWEKKKIKGRMLPALRRSYDAGLRTYPNLYGWKSEQAITDTGRLVWTPILHEQEMIRYIYDLAIQGLGLSAISRKLHSEGYRRHDGGAFTHSAVRQILQNEVYAGMTHDSKGKQIKSAIYNPIVTMEQWSKVQELYPTNITTNKRGRRPCHPMTSTFCCSECGTSFTYYYGIDKRRIDKSTGEPRKMEAYIHNSRVDCCGKKRFDYDIINIIGKMLYAKAMTDRPLDLVGKLQGELKTDKTNADIERLDAHIHKLTKEISNLQKIVMSMDDVAEDDITIVEIKNKKLELKETQLAKKIKVDSIIENTKRKERILAEFAVDKLAKYAKADGKVKRDMMKAIIQSGKASIVDNEDIISFELIDGRKYNFNYTQMLQARKESNKVKMPEILEDEEDLQKFLQLTNMIGGKLVGMVEDTIINNQEI